MLALLLLILELGPLETIFPEIVSAGTVSSGNKTAQYCQLWKQKAENCQIWKQVRKMISWKCLIGPSRILLTVPVESC